MLRPEDQGDERASYARRASASFDGGKAPLSDMFDRIQVAIGRRPNGRLIGAENAGVHVDERGFIRGSPAAHQRAAHLRGRRHRRPAVASPPFSTLNGISLGNTMENSGK